MIVKFGTDKEVYSVDIPTNLSQIKYESHIDFRLTAEKFERHHKKVDEDLEDLDEDEREEMAVLTYEPHEEQMMLIEALSYVIKGDLDKMPFFCESDTQESIKEMLSKGYIIKLGDDISTIRLYAHYITIVNQYRPKKPLNNYKKKWRWKDKQTGRFVTTMFHIDPMESATALECRRPYTNGELILINRFNQNADKKAKVKDNLNGNIDFNLSIEELSVLLRPKGVELPMTTTAQVAYIDKMKHAFRDFPLSDVLDVRFFFLNTINRLVKNHVTSSSLKAKNQKAKRSNKRKGS